MKIFTVKRMARIAMMAALCVVLRQAFAFLPNVQPITAIFLVLVPILGIIDAILVMALTMLVSSFLLGLGPWVALQIVSFAIMMLLWRVYLTLVTRGGKSDIIILFVETIGAGLVGIGYGIVIDSLSAFMFNMPWWSYVAAGFFFNLAHALSTLIFFPLITSFFRRLSHEKTIV
ncbi:ECF transporter S component [Streptococcus sp. S784/96/1]|uniref:ECF transporter S component n=1 Tax=Streptococcus sp. S784/96/1 TaxID=2653499 RepID=UPI001386DF93|nr:ECF transporter S component [Streptococcus sp. S784/96/1]